MCVLAKLLEPVQMSAGGNNFACYGGSNKECPPPPQHIDPLLVMVLGEVMEPLGGGALIDSTGVGFEALRTSASPTVTSPTIHFTLSDFIHNALHPQCTSSAVHTVPTHLWLLLLHSAIMNPSPLEP